MTPKKFIVVFVQIDPFDAAYDTLRECALWAESDSDARAKFIADWGEGNAIQCVYEDRSEA